MRYVDLRDHHKALLHASKDRLGRNLTAEEMGSAFYLKEHGLIYIIHTEFVRGTICPTCRYRGQGHYNLTADLTSKGRKMVCGKFAASEAGKFNEDGEGER